MSGTASRLQVLAAAALFSTGGAAIKATALSGWQVASFRSGVAALAVFLVLPAARGRWSLRAVGVGVTYAATMILFVLGNKLTTAANTIFLQSTAPLYLLLLGPLLLAEPVRRRDVAYMAALAGGLALFFVGAEAPSATAPHPVAGNLVAVASGLTWALTVLGLRALGRGPATSRQGPGGGAPSTGVQAVLIGNVLAFAGSLPLALPVVAPRLEDFAIVGGLGVFQIGLAYVLLTRGLEGVPALEASLLLLLEPVLNPVWAWLVHGERPGPWAAAGGAVILAATVAKTAWDAKGRLRLR